MTLLQRLISTLSARAPSSGASARSHGTELATREFPVEAFSHLEVGGAFEVHARMGDVAHMTVTTESRLLPLVTVLQRGDKLLLSMSDSFSTLHPPRVALVFPALSGLTIRGAASVKMADAYSTKLALHVEGAGRATVSGMVGALELVASGAAHARCADLRAGTVRAELNGAARASVRALVSMRVRASGAAYFKGYGRTPERDIRTSGAARVDFV